MTSVRRFVDLHTHSSASDGALSPAELVRKADAEGLAAVALTDHDTIDGLGEAIAAARELPDLRFVSGVEISAKLPEATLHVLGLGIDPAGGQLRELLDQLLAARNERNPKMIAKLRQMGVEISLEEVTAVALGGVDAAAGNEHLIVGRMHMAELLRRKGCVRTTQEAFDKYLGDGAPAYVDKERLTPEQAIDAVHGAGGAAVLAHPAQLHCQNRAQLERIVRGLLRHGLDAVEVYHCDHTPEQTRAYLDLARRLGLGITGGSDFHGPARADAVLGRPRVPLSVIDDKLAKLLFPKR